MVASETLSLRLQGSRLGKQKCNRKWDLAAHCSEANEEARLVKRKACFNFSADNRGKGGRVSIGRLLSTDSQGARTFIDWGRGLHVETAQSLLTVLLKLVIGWLIRFILIVWDAVNLQFQGQFVSISLRPVLRVVAAYVLAIVWSQVVNFFHLVGVSVSLRQLTGYLSPWEETKDPWVCLMSTLLLFSLLWLFSFIFAPSHFSD